MLIEVSEEVLPQMIPGYWGRHRFSEIFQCEGANQPEFIVQVPLTLPRILPLTFTMHLGTSSWRRLNNWRPWSAWPWKGADCAWQDPFNIYPYPTFLYTCSYKIGSRVCMSMENGYRYPIQCRPPTSTCPTTICLM